MVEPLYRFQYMGVQRAMVYDAEGVCAFLAQILGRTVGNIADLFHDAMHTVKGLLGDALALPGII